MISKITKRAIESVKPGSRDVFLWDSELANFGCKITPSGRRVYIVQYRHGGRRRRYTLGKHGDVTPDQARKEATKVLGEVASGQDPAGQRAGMRQVPTLKQLAERYLKEHAQQKKKPKSLKEDGRLLDKKILPALGRHRVSSVTRQDVSKLHHRLRGTPFQANRVLSLLSKMFTLAERWGLRPDNTNPSKHVERFKEKKRERYLSLDELARLGVALREAEEKRSDLPGAITAIRLLILTGARFSEILDLKWGEVDLQFGALRLPDSKTGSKIVLLGRPAIELLERIPRQADNPFVCPGYKEGSNLRALHKTWYRIRVKAAIEDVRIHDLRHSFASIGAGAGLGLPVIGGLLGHTEPATTARYSHLAADPLKRAADLISVEIDRAMKETPKRGQVIELKKR